ncbi:MAG: efflux RND transporter periplasmic adaptor subunit [Paludibacter sp.]|nr:efflux RND transporter periplasmic adaptor subunit [Paludibacter sp.]
MKNKIFLFAILASLFASCNKKQEETKPEEVKIQFTAYSPEFEVFAEADPFVMNQTGGILSHFSHLPSFLALEKGSVTIRLIVDGNEVSQVLEQPTRKGIYKFELKPLTKGTGKIMYDFKIENKSYQLEIPNVVVYATAEEANEAAAKVVIPGTNTTVFTKEQSWKIDFATDYPKLEPFGQVIKTTAQVQSAPGDEVIVSAKAAGVVQLSANNVLEGKSVSSGQTLFSITSNGLAGNNTVVQFAEAKNNFEKAEADYDRAKELAKDKIVSDKELLNAKNLYDNAKAVYSNMNKNFSSSGQSVKSPMNGFVKQVFIQNGQSVEAGQAVVSVSQNKTLLLRAEVQQKYASILGSIHSATIRTLNDNQTYTLEQLNGKVLSYGKTANSDNYMLPVNLQIDNKGSFVSGGFVEIYLKSMTNSQALTIPNPALLEEQGVYYVYVQVNPELFEKREVKIGGTDGLNTEILQGITEKDRIATKGAMMIKLAQATGNLDAHSGHNH